MAERPPGNEDPLNRGVSPRKRTLGEILMDTERLRWEEELLRPIAPQPTAPQPTVPNPDRRKFLKKLGISAAAIFGVTALTEGARRLLAVTTPDTDSGRSSEQPTGKKEIFAFIRGKQIETLIEPDAIDFSAITILAYFGLPIEASGKLLTDQGDYQSLKHPKVSKLFQKAREADAKVVLTITQLDNDGKSFADKAIVKLLDDPEAQKRAIEGIIKEVKAGKFNGVNIDLEEGADLGQIYRFRFNQFIKKLGERLHQEVKNSHLSVSVYARSGIDSTIYDVEDLGKYCDAIFMMAYGYQSSKVASPTAPIYRDNGGWDVATSLARIVEQVPRNKVVVGMPLYGPRVIVGEPRLDAPIIRRLQEYTIAQAMEMVTKAPTLVQGFDPKTKAEWIARPSDNGNWEMILVGRLRFFEEWLSFVKKEGVSLGFWTIDHYAYNNPDPQFWRMILQKFSTDLNKHPEAIRRVSANQKIDKIVSYRMDDEKWSREVKDLNLTIRTGETSIAMVLSTLTKHKMTPLDVAKAFKEKGLRDPEKGLFMRTGTDKDIFAWLSNEHKLVVTKILDRYHPLYTSPEERKAPFDYEYANYLLNQGNMIIFSGVPKGSQADIVALLKGLDQQQKTLTIIDASDGKEKQVHEDDFDPIVYAYAVRARN